MAMNGRVPIRYGCRHFSQELGEAELAQPGRSELTDVERMLDRWFRSDVPLAGRLSAVMQDAFGDSQFAQGRLQVSDQRVALEQIKCPVLKHDRLVRRSIALPSSSGSVAARLPTSSFHTEPRAHGEPRGA